MSTQSVEEITFILQLLGFSIAGLILLLLLIRLLTVVLKHMARKRVSLADMSLIGQEATVIRTVRPKKPGEIECEWQGVILTGSAVCDRILRPGRRVLITAADQGVYRVRLAEEPTIQSLNQE